MGGCTPTSQSVWCLTRSYGMPMTWPRIWSFSVSRSAESSGECLDRQPVMHSAGHGSAALVVPAREHESLADRNLDKIAAWRTHPRPAYRLLSCPTLPKEGRRPLAAGPFRPGANSGSFGCRRKPFPGCDRRRRPGLHRLGASN